MKRGMEIKRILIGLCVSLILAVSGTSLAQAACVATTWDLTAGQTIKVGTVMVTNDASNLYVTYTLTSPGATFGSLHMWAGNDITNVPANAQGIPVPGQFDKALGGASYDATALTSYTFTIPFSSLSITDVTKTCGNSLYVVTHAEVKMGNGANETAFGGDMAGSGNRWWYYGSYAICCDFGAPQTCNYETAFAKGGYVWTTDVKSNPEKLPSLNLTKNRWGWATNLKATGTTYYNIWAGAGLNKISKAEMVGTLSVNWNGYYAVVTYDMFSGYRLEEVHIYGGDKKPATTAPGQYGYPAAGYNVNGVSMYSYAIPVTDTDGDGVWLIAHAVVSSGTCQ